MSRTKVFKTLSFVIGLAMLLASIMAFLGFSPFSDTSNIGITGSSLVGAYFIFYALTGKTDILNYFKTNQV
ncbi:hypothetical protein Q4506_11320 [Colwellia sp. 4_MG-2023]|jgi:hypothetical protein|uniref:hypothetical protein n=1 Tax=unclassified Colwellia TaxID=196834 RepID=UPI001C09353B|nr:MULTISPECIES: hypothetical protein [unclassified Colwellia]MBU2923369.1 hypothetical protein [Colwellia sp. C2M11]MDO6507994.1 hypothetical protein [Colwellia sp. 5_MG-2023]MDO6556278.1 hypothetical protein [Colwellia sp. 4_MG-2023]MDO6653729.1 hypothetical protein [Colwellia sp. 3_MG-2023]MDO6666641.1 hypothetical protein [Colwellia sp. 2_MG-2023]